MKNLSYFIGDLGLKKVDNHYFIKHLITLQSTTCFRFVLSKKSSLTQTDCTRINNVGVCVCMLKYNMYDYNINDAIH